MTSNICINHLHNCSCGLCSADSTWKTRFSLLCLKSALEFLKELGPTAKLHQSWKYICPDLASPTRIWHVFCVVHHYRGPVLVFSPAGTRKDVSWHFFFQHLAEHQRLFSWLLGWTVKAGSICLRRVFASGRWSALCRVLFLTRGQTVDGSSVLCKREIKAMPRWSQKFPSSRPHHADIAS